MVSVYRWMQLASFLPGLEISVGPWQYDKQVTDMTLDLLSQRRDRIVSVLQGAAKEHIITGDYMLDHDVST